MNVIKSYFLCCGFLFFSTLSYAETSPLTLTAATSLAFDNNLFRLSAPVQATVKSGGAEQIHNTNLSLNFSTSLSLQKLDATISFADHRYQNFNNLSYTSYDYAINFKWSLTPSLHGTLVLDRKETLNSFADFAGINQRNQRTDSSNRLNAIYEVDGPWRILADLVQTTQSNQQALQVDGDYSTNALNTGFAYVFPSGSSVTLKQKTAFGQYKKLLASDFEQRSTDLRLHWVLPETSTAELFLTQFNQSHPNNAQRDFNGLNSGASLNWLLTGKSSVALGFASNVASYASANDNYTTTKRYFISPSWQISAKTLLRLRHEWTDIQYQGAPILATPSQRQDSTRDTGLSFYWQPDQRLSFSASLQNSARSSTQANVDYDSSQVSISAQYSY